MHDYTDAQGWSLTYPSALHVIQGLPPTAFARQLTLTSFAAPRKLAGRSPTRKLLSVSSLPYVLPLDAAGRFPADGAALILQPFRGFALGPDSAFPLVLDQFGRPQAEPFFSSADDRRAAIPPGRTHIVVGYSQEIIVTVLIGAKASSALRSDLASTIASLSFRRLAPGSLVGGAEILGPASAYPVGSFTLIRRTVRPELQRTDLSGPRARPARVRPSVLEQQPMHAGGVLLRDRTSVQHTARSRAPVSAPTRSPTREFYCATWASDGTASDALSPAPPTSHTSGRSRACTPRSPGTVRS